MRACMRVQFAMADGLFDVLNGKNKVVCDFGSTKQAKKGKKFPSKSIVVVGIVLLQAKSNC